MWIILLLPLLAGLLAIAVPLAIILPIVAYIIHKRQDIVDAQKDIIDSIGKNVKETVKTVKTADSSEQKTVDDLIKDGTVKEKDVVNYVLNKYGKGVKH